MTSHPPVNMEGNYKLIARHSQKHGVNCFLIFLLWLLSEQQLLPAGLILINEHLSYLGLMITYFPRIWGEGRAKRWLGYGKL